MSREEEAKAFKDRWLAAWAKDPVFKSNQERAKKRVEETRRILEKLQTEKKK